MKETVIETRALRMRMFACLGQVNPSYKNQWMTMFFLPTNRFGAPRITLWAHEEFNSNGHFNLENCSFTGALLQPAWFFWWIFLFPHRCPLWGGKGGKTNWSYLYIISKWGGWLISGYKQSYYCMHLSKVWQACFFMRGLVMTPNKKCKIQFE